VRQSLSDYWRATFSATREGAFTGAVARKLGRFESANGGTLFLDEIGDIPLELQTKLLRVLQEQEFERLGSTQTVRVDVRLVAATNRDLAALVSTKQFRSDLYYRLNVFPVSVPALRDRPEDIPLLAMHFVKTFAVQMGNHIDKVPTAVTEALINYSWPGNIRELQNFIERSVILTSGNALRPPLADSKITNEPKYLELLPWRTRSAITFSRLSNKPDGWSPVPTGRPHAWESRGPRFTSGCRS
jgi:formate hydrogenlyase transcriptional activator